jgi:hypothetical protein
VNLDSRERRPPDYCEHAECGGVCKRKDTAAALAEILRAFLVRCGRPDLRNKLAARLAREGLFAAELLAICETVEERGKPAAQTAAILGSILETEESWRASIADVVFAREARRKREAKREAAKAEAAAPYPNMPGGVLSSPSGPCAHGTPPTESCTLCSGGSQP